MLTIGQKYQGLSLLKSSLRNLGLSLDTQMNLTEL